VTNTVSGKATFMNDVVGFVFGDLAPNTIQGLGDEHRQRLAEQAGIGACGGDPRLQRGMLERAVIWRSAIVAAYVLLAVLVGTAYGGSGLTTLFFFYLWAGAWVVFALVWGRAARAAGRWNVERLERAPSVSDGDSSEPGKGESVMDEHQGVSVEPGAISARIARRRKPVFGF
jgi:hypothetical protein